jgi:hypothetical protein
VAITIAINVEDLEDSGAQPKRQHAAGITEDLHGWRVANPGEYLLEHVEHVAVITAGSHRLLQGVQGPIDSAGCHRDHR